MTAVEELGHLADVPVSLEMELDRKLMSVEEILEWRKGSVVWLTRSAGENMDIRVGGVVIGFGEIVVIENTFGIRVTDYKQEP